MALNKINYVDNETIITANNLNQIQDEIINSSFPRIDIGITSAEDVVSYWRDCGNGYNLIGTLDTVIDQPQQYGLLLNFVCWEDVFQIWNSQPGNGTYFRSGNHDGWSGTWRKAIDYDIYPIGSIYMNVNSTSPAAIYGGTWEQITDKFLLGAGGSYAAGATGGETTVTLTVDQIPSHTHQFRTTTSAVASGSNYSRMSSSGSWVSNLIRSAGGGQAHNNMPPYLAVYIWKRVS